MQILVSNDDGYSPKASASSTPPLARACQHHDRCAGSQRSGASNSPTLDAAARSRRLRRALRVVGTPTDCVYIAISGYFDFIRPGLRGINDGPNLATTRCIPAQLRHRGPVPGLPIMAFSLCMEPDSGRNFDAAARVAQTLVGRLLEQPLERGFTLNVNIPDVPYNQLRGIRATRLGGRHRSEPIVPVSDPKGRRMYWIGPAGEGQDAGEGTDFDAVANGYVSVTPLQIDLTRHAALPTITEWLRPLA
jgi:5'-nucleotidase